MHHPLDEGSQSVRRVLQRRATATIFPDQAVNGPLRPLQRREQVSTSPEVAARLVGYADSIRLQADLMAAAQAALTWKRRPPTARR
jgi:hypothetical protein